MIQGGASSGALKSEVTAPVNTAPQENSSKGEQPHHNINNKIQKGQKTFNGKRIPGPPQRPVKDAQNMEKPRENAPKQKPQEDVPEHKSCDPALIERREMQKVFKGLANSMNTWHLKKNESIGLIKDG